MAVQELDHRFPDDDVQKPDPMEVITTKILKPI
jgi:hypothetical protein